MHTPGPWTASPITDTEEHLVWAADPDAGLVYEKYPARVGGVCKLFGSSRVAADARLIASAPDLLEAAKAAAEWANSGGPMDWALIVVWRDLLRAAIARAEGP